MVPDGSRRNQTVSRRKQWYQDEIEGYHMNPLSDRWSFELITAMMTDRLEGESEC
jgi:hypothetical protein